uniref:Uncharacterized protein n=1 Tax=Glossina austeni TaxID=7395 RepID=A0A1A9VM67_GLOAU
MTRVHCFISPIERYMVDSLSVYAANNIENLHRRQYYERKHLLLYCGFQFVLYGLESLYEFLMENVGGDLIFLKSHQNVRATGFHNNRNIIYDYNNLTFQLRPPYIYHRHPSRIIVKYEILEVINYSALYKYQFFYFVDADASIDARLAVPYAGSRTPITLTLVAAALGVMTSGAI